MFVEKKFVAVMERREQAGKRAGSKWRSGQSERVQLMKLHPPIYNDLLKASYSYVI